MAGLNVINIIKSGEINAPTGYSPTGQPMALAVDNPYVTKDDFMQSYEASGLGLSVNDPFYDNGELDRKLLQASAWVNRHCRRWFDTQTIDSTKTGFIVRPFNPQMLTVVMLNRPITAINSIYIQVLNWFIQVEVASSGYLQIYPDKGFMKIVPLLSSAGTGVGSPIPAAILDHIPLGTLWTNYTFGYGTPLTGVALAQIGTTNKFQSPQGKRLWAPDQPITVYENAVKTAKTYTADFPNGIITFDSAPTLPVTADYTSNESTPFDIKEATQLYACHLIGQATQNPLGAKSLGIQTFNVSFGDKSNVLARVEDMLEPYVDRLPVFVGV